MVYWMHLFLSPVYNIKMIKSIMAHFLCLGTRGAHKYHLVCFDTISRDNESGGWGILDVRVFGWELSIKSSWRTLYGKGLWHEIIFEKYMKWKLIMEWYKRGEIGMQKDSYMWKSFHKVKNGSCLCYSGHWAKGIKSWLALNLLLGLVFIPVFLTVEALHARGFFFLDQVIGHWNDSYPIWKNAVEIGLVGANVSFWEHFTQVLQTAGLSRKACGDSLIWLGTVRKGSVVVSDIYRYILSKIYPTTTVCWYQNIWRWDVPLKIIIFYWLVWCNKVLT